MCVGPHDGRRGPGRTISAAAKPAVAMAQLGPLVQHRQKTRRAAHRAGKRRWLPATVCTVVPALQLFGPSILGFMQPGRAFPVDVRDGPARLHMAHHPPAAAAAAVDAFATANTTLHDHDIVRAKCAAAAAAAAANTHVLPSGYSSVGTSVHTCYAALPASRRCHRPTVSPCAAGGSVSLSRAMDVGALPLPKRAKMP